MTNSSAAKDSRFVKLGDVAIRVMEQHEATLSSPEPWVGAQHLDEGDLKIRRWSMSDDPVFPPTFKFKFPIGAVLIHSRNPKKVAIADFSAITGEKIFALSARDESVLSSQYLALVLQSAGFEDFTNEWMTGSVNKFLNWSALEKFEFALPPVAEQLRLVQLTQHLQSVHEAYTVALNENRSVRVSFMNEVCQDRDRVELKERLKTLTKGTTPTSVGENFSEDGVPFVKAENILDGTLDLGRRTFISIATNNELLRSQIFPGDVLLTIAGTIGRSAVVGQELPQANCNQAVAILRPLEDLHPFFLSEWLRSADAARQISSGQVSNTISNLSLGTISDLKLPLLSPQEQASVVETLMKIRELDFNLQQTVSEVMVLKRSCFELLPDRMANV